ncbi:MAG: YdeI/OmpD-associated family protein [Pseudomonadota bacterium]
MAKRPKESAEEVEIATSADLTAWLHTHHTRNDGVWLVHPKKAAPTYIPMGEIIDELLCWGWIDSLSRGKDELRTMHWIAPRNPKSNWSRVNKDKIAALEAAGRLRPAGQAMVAAAKQCGTWTALDDVENGIRPPDLDARLTADGLIPDWDALPRSVRRGALEILLNAKQQATRDRKIQDIVDALQAGQRPFQWVPKS